MTSVTGIDNRLRLLDELNRVTGLKVDASDDLYSASGLFADALKAFRTARVGKFEPGPAVSERASLLSALQEMKPPKRPRTHGDWARAWKEDGELAMWERAMALVEKQP